MKFNIKDINGKELWAKVKAEAHEIYHNPNKKNDDRTLAEIQNINFYGLAPEQFLIENCGFHNDPRKYKDRKSTRLNSSHWLQSRMPSSA